MADRILVLNAGSSSIKLTLYAAIRARVARRAAWLGVELDEALNQTGGPRISSATSPVAVYAIPTDEQLVIARHTLAAIGRR